MDRSAATAGLLLLGAGILSVWLHSPATHDAVRRPVAAASNPRRQNVSAARIPRLTPATTAPGELMARSNGRASRLITWWKSPQEQVGHWPPDCKDLNQGHPAVDIICNLPP